MAERGKNSKGFRYNSKRKSLQKNVESLSAKFPIVDWKTCTLLTENFNVLVQNLQRNAVPRTTKVIGQLATRSGMDLKMAKTCYHSHYIDGDSGNGNGGNGNGRNENPNEYVRGARPVARECTYQDFMKCQPLNLKGTEGVVRLIRWFEKMETVFHISNCPKKSQVKYATCTLLDRALTWWNSHKRTIGTEAAFAMSWGELTKLMTEVYCPRNEIQKMETKL
ncbi:hypothetical protein Tco_1080787 [Tanacetum coccineum]|uniref:Retrotransposon gag domain-containing protein n=1 Tax=Tanacetum coccineum TaxID=301880 RepID=A0ABQ5HXP3_9ASTR